MNQDHCNEQYGGRITERMICAGYEEGGKDARNRDSGGPLVAFADDGKPELIGVISFGIDFAEQNYPGVYARVTSVRSWIKEVSGI